MAALKYVDDSMFDYNNNTVDWADNIMKYNHDSNSIRFYFNNKNQTNVSKEPVSLTRVMDGTYSFYC